MTTEQVKKKFKFPTAFTILVLITVVVAILTFVIPAGRYDYDENGQPVPGSYHAVDPNPQRDRTPGPAVILMVIIPSCGYHKGQDGDHHSNENQDRESGWEFEFLLDLFCCHMRCSFCLDEWLNS